MTCTARLWDTGTNDSIDFYDNGDYVSNVAKDSICFIEEGTLSLPTPPKIQVLSGESPFRHGQDLVLSSYNNREITFSMTIRVSTTAPATGTQHDVVRRIVLFNRFFERARQYEIWNVRRGIQFELKLKESGSPVTFDVIDGEINLPETGWDKTNFFVDRSYGTTDYVLTNVTVRLVCKPFARGAFEQLVSGQVLQMNDEGFNFIYLYNASGAVNNRLERSGGVLNYAGQDRYYLFPSNLTSEMPATGDALIIGAKSQFFGMRFTISDVAAYSACNFVWEYWTGASWASMGMNLTNFKTAGRVNVSWTSGQVSGWTASTGVAGNPSVLGDNFALPSGYYMRITLSSATGWSAKPQQDWDIVHRNRDNRLYVAQESIKGDAPAPAVIVIKSGRNTSLLRNDGNEPANGVLYPTTQLKAFALSRYRIERIRGLYEAELADTLYNAWGALGGSMDEVNNEVTASNDDYVRWGVSDTTGRRIVRWKMSTSSGVPRDRWGNYAFSIRYRDINASTGAKWAVKMKCYVYSNANNQIYGEEGRWYDLPSPYGTIHPDTDLTNIQGGRWTTVDVAQFPIPPAAVSYQTGYFVYLELWLKCTNLSPSPAFFDLDYAYMWPTDQSYLSARTRYNAWYETTTDDNLDKAAYALIDSEQNAIQIVNHRYPVESNAAGTPIVALAGFDEYQSGRFPYIYPGHDWMFGVYTKNDTSNRYDAMEDTVTVDVYYYPHFIHLSGNASGAELEVA